MNRNSVVRTFTRAHEGRVSRSLLLIALSLVAASASAQLDRGTITGTVRDSGGSVIAHGSVTVRNTETGVTESVTTNTDGTYQVLGLNPGTYSVEATASKAVQRWTLRYRWDLSQYR